MTEIPKIVRERLQVSKSATTSHPDPNVLAAFAEQSLPQAERRTVLDHLARCAGCREILALALPASEPVPVAAGMTSQSWFAWPRVRWAFASAALVAVVLIGVNQFGHRSLTVQMAKNNEAPAAVRPEEPAAPAQTQTVPQAEATQSEAAKNSRTLTAKDIIAVEKNKNAPSSPVPPVIAERNYSHLAVGGRLHHGPRQMNQWQQQSANVQQDLGPAVTSNAVSATGQSAGAALALVPGPTTQMVEVQAQAAAPELKDETADSLIANNRASSQPNASDTEVSRAKSAASSPAPMRSEGRAVHSLLTSPTWTITSGRLQRSLDQGATWQDVNVTGSGGTESSLELTAARKMAKASQKRDTQEQSSPMIFRAVAANGPEVWAGGTGAMLYHSSDAGAHWLRVTPTASNTSLTGDIVTLDFSEAQNGRVFTSTGEVWTTTDNGQTWQKR